MDKKRRINNPEDMLERNGDLKDRCRYVAILAVLAIALGPRPSDANDTPVAVQGPVTAIDVALEPDATMIQHVDAANAALLKVFPKGFALDATHHPHVTLIQQFVSTADLPKIYAALGKLFATSNAASWKLTAFKYYYIPSGSIGLAGVVVRTTPALLKLQQEVVDVVVPFSVKTGTAAAFYTTPSEPDIQSDLIGYVSTFVPNASGKHFNPHVTTGIGPVNYLDKLLAEPFDAFTFSLVGASVYQLGDFGTARKKLAVLRLGR